MYISVNPVQVNWVDELFDTKTCSGNKVSKPVSERPLLIVLFHKNNTILRPICMGFTMVRQLSFYQTRWMTIKVFRQHWIKVDSWGYRISLGLSYGQIMWHVPVKLQIWTGNLIKPTICTIDFYFYFLKRASESALES